LHVRPELTNASTKTRTEGKKRDTPTNQYVQR